MTIEIHLTLMKIQGSGWNKCHWASDVNRIVGMPGWHLDMAGLIANPQVGVSSEETR